MSVPAYQNHDNAIEALYAIIGIIPETFIYGVYSCMFPVFVFVMLTKGLRSRVRKILFFMSLFMYTTSTVHWSLSVASVILMFKNDFISPASLDVSFYLPLFSAITLFNYLLTDGVVVWRAWVLCNDQSRGVLKIPIALLICLAITVTVTIAFRIRLTVMPISPELFALMNWAIDVSQIASLVISLMANISATTIISMKAWKFRRDITRDFARKQTNGSRIMALIVESGILYGFSGITFLLTSLIRLEYGTLGDIYTPVTFQLAGIYPIVVILLVNQGSSMDKTVFMSAIPHHSNSARTYSDESHLETMRFDIPINTVDSNCLSSQSSQSSPDMDSHIGDKGLKGVRFSAKEKSLPDIPLSPSSVVDIKVTGTR
ncbi:hypothetical protein BT96DRAFT_976447 [Gymnopus androsaceus JB14]|uniref:Uncharacterized protein n=1 Tax=Gymnopus androsaceus JB14 TaxID=1447944 RepID=A0A6A4HHS8_9AGAR|nr:hypothetical protein BT96DRAFT_976447 [Gymnopus androsaceus JB14]